MGTQTPAGGGHERDGKPSRPPAALTPDLVALATRVGRHDWNPTGGDDEALIAACCVLPLAAEAEADPAAFLHQLARTCLPAGAWAAYGAERLALRLFGAASPWRHHPAWCSLIDRSLVLHRARLLPYPLLPDYLAEHYEALGGDPEGWLQRSTRPRRRCDHPARARRGAPRGGGPGR